MADLEVTVSALKSAAEEISRDRFKGVGGQPDVAAIKPEPPDALNSTKEVCLRLQNSADAMAAAFKAGDREAERLAAAMKAAASAYEKLDQQSGTGLDGQVRDGGGAPPAVEPVFPDLTELKSLHSIELPHFEARFDDIDEDSNYGWRDMVRAIHEWDPHDMACNGLKNFADSWRAYAGVLNAHAGKFQCPPIGWSGEAARACEAALRSLGEWWIQMAGECDRLATETERVIDAHGRLVEKHPDMDDLHYYENMSNINPNKVPTNIASWNRSDDAREAYAGDLKIAQSRPSRPPGILGLPPLNANEVGKNPNAQPPGVPGDSGMTGGEPGTGGATPEMPEMPGVPEMPSMSPAGLDPSAGGPSSGSPSGGSPSGGSPSGGSPGGGAPSGGSPSGAPTGMPEGPATDVPALDEPTLAPASAGGGGGPGGGGGDIPKTPLAPAVGAENVAPSKGGPGIPAGAPGGPGAAGGMGGGMGGMGGGHGQGGQRGDKRRDPKLAPDEELYKEDRAWTEAVIGNRRRTDVKDTNK
ncbi:PPE domain-containing protein [Mycolicibacterium houstonense]|uniref:PPE domain-containing protein n=1 Tax=Mycolicibacterium houstonense TaxID=146021 RepID=UPI00082B44E3|nr:hypothetical protein [Mycolicibacterium houstonense]